MPCNKGGRKYRLAWKYCRDCEAGACKAINVPALARQDWLYINFEKAGSFVTFSDVFSSDEKGNDRKLA